MLENQVMMFLQTLSKAYVSVKHFDFCLGPPYQQPCALQQVKQDLERSEAVSTLVPGGKLGPGV